MNNQESTTEQVTFVVFSSFPRVLGRQNLDSILNQFLPLIMNKQTYKGEGSKELTRRVPKKAGKDDLKGYKLFYSLEIDSYIKFNYIGRKRDPQIPMFVKSMQRAQLKNVQSILKSLN